jgi:hypothetical protein
MGAPGQIGRSFEWCQRAEIPDALKIRVAVRGARRRPCLRRRRLVWTPDGDDDTTTIIVAATPAEAKNRLTMGYLPCVEAEIPTCRHGKKGHSLAILPARSELKLRAKLDQPPGQNLRRLQIGSTESRDLAKHGVRVEQVIDIEHPPQENTP